MYAKRPQSKNYGLIFCPNANHWNDYLVYSLLLPVPFEYRQPFFILSIAYN